MRSALVLAWIAALGGSSGCTVPSANKHDPGATPDLASKSTISKPGVAQDPASLSALRAKAEAAPSDPRIQVQYAYALRAENKSQSAKKLRELARMHPDLREAQVALASLYKESEYADRELELWQSWLNRNPNDVGALLRAAELSRRFNDNAASADILKRAAGIDPDNPEVVSAIGVDYYHAGKFDEGAKALKEYLGTSQGTDALYHELSEVQRAGAHFKDAETAIREAVRLAPSEPKHHRQLGHILITSNDKSRLDEAQREIKLAMDSGDQSIDARYWYAMSLDLQGKTQEAITAYEAVSKDDLRYDKTAFRLGSLYIKTNRIQEGRNLLKMYKVMERNLADIGDAVRRLRLHPEQPQHYVRLGKYQRLTEDYGSAIGLLRRGQKMFPKSSEIRHELEHALLEAGRKTEAALLADKKSTSKGK